MPAVWKEIPGMPTITISQLESHLWEAANILRGPVDAADFKSYVFPLLFFKSHSDVHDEEHEAELEEFDGNEEATLFLENYRFQVAEGCHWRDARKVAKSVGRTLQKSLRGIGQANPHTVYAIFGRVREKGGNLGLPLYLDSVKSHGAAGGEAGSNRLETALRTWLQSSTEVRFALELLIRKAPQTIK